MAKMKDFDPKTLSERLVARTKSNDFKQMVLRNESSASPAASSQSKSMRLSVRQMFDR